jgi:hypothetical protein
MNKEHLLDILILLDYKPLSIYPVSKKDAIRIIGIKHTKKELEEIIIGLLKKIKK